MSRTLIITGASGFLGAELLHELSHFFDRTLSLSGRRPKNVTETSSAIETVSSVDELVDAMRGIKPAQVWNCASLLSYGCSELAESTSVNTDLPLELFERCTPTEGFFHISTVGVTDTPAGETVAEELTNSLMTRIPYIVTKTFAEHLLFAQAKRRSVPTTIIRTGSLIGNINNPHEVSNKSGYFSLADGIARARRRGAPLTTQVSAEARPPLVGTQHVARFCAHLSQRGSWLIEPVILHALDQRLTVGQMVQAVNLEYGDDVWSLGDPQVAFDSAFAKANDENLRFMEETRHFDNVAWTAWRHEQGITDEILLSNFAQYMHRHIADARNRLRSPR